MQTALRNFLCLTLIGLLTTSLPQFGMANSARGEREQAAEQDLKVADASLNKVYQQLLDKIDTPSQKLIREAQRAWIAFRDAQAEARASMTSRGGNNADRFAVEIRVDLTNARTEELKKMLAELEPQ